MCAFPVCVYVRVCVLFPCASACVFVFSHARVCVCAPCRPPEMGVPPPGKAVLSMSGLSHGVIRVDTEEKLSVLTVQDVGQVMPGGTSCLRVTHSVSGGPAVHCVYLCIRQISCTYTIIPNSWK